MREILVELSSKHVNTDMVKYYSYLDAYDVPVMLFEEPPAVIKATIAACVLAALDSTRLYAVGGDCLYTRWLITNKLGVRYSASRLGLSVYLFNPNTLEIRLR